MNGFNNKFLTLFNNFLKKLENILAAKSTLDLKNNSTNPIKDKLKVDNYLSYITPLKTSKLSSVILCYLRSKFSINMIYLNILLIFGIVLCLGAPIIINTLTGVNIYDPNLNYSMSFFQIRICCATVFLHLLIYFFVLNKIRLKLSIFNKPIM
jgi:uncharacterized membrane protein